MRQISDDCYMFDWEHVDTRDAGGVDGIGHFGYAVAWAPPTEGDYRHGLYDQPPCEEVARLMFSSRKVPR